MQYSFLIENMVWSYSRLTTFEDCRYKFFLKYIMGMSGTKLFYAEYGNLLHKIIEKYLNGEFTKDEAVTFYLENYNQVFKSAPHKIAGSYFTQGLKYVKNFTPPCEGTVEVEKKVNFKIDIYDFVGFIDILASSQKGYTICDNKSRNLKRGKSGKTKSDLELQKYLRQLYLYSEAINQLLGINPTTLMFNCFRGGYKIKEPFDAQKKAETCAWAVDLIKKIEKNDDWSPNLDWFYCNFICDQQKNCEYFSLL